MVYITATHETVLVAHRDSRGFPDYTIKLSFTYHQESGQWVGVCDELGTSAFADTAAQMQAELLEAVELQLNEVARLTDVRAYLADNQVEILPIELPEHAGFAIV